jgi:hypothetical protein
MVRALSLERGRAESREVWYFESPTLEQYARGTVFRLRMGSQERVLTVKASGADCARVDPSLIPAGQGKCEYDVHGEAMQGVVSLELELDEATVRGLLDGRIALASTLSPAQIRYLQILGRWPVAADLRRLGPVRLETYSPGEGCCVVDLWQLPGGRRDAEVSQKTPVAEVDRVRAEILEKLAKAGLEPCPDQSSQAAAKLRALLAAP